MPLIIPKTLPAFDALYEENVFVMHRERALAQHIRPLEILILNLMPTKIATETQIALPVPHILIGPACFLILQNIHDLFFKFKTFDGPLIFPEEF